MARNPEQFTIGQLSHATGCKVPTIRYFEQIGLLPAPGRSAGNTRMFDAAHRVRLDFIQHCRDLGFSRAAVSLCWHDGLTDG
jgi:DNA-binding transcriptional MerR regulator